MNARTASLLTALLFLATPLAFVPGAQAQGGPCVDPTPATPDPLWSKMCTLATTLTAVLQGTDMDGDGRADLAKATAGPGSAFIQLDYFFTDGNAATKDEAYAYTGSGDFRFRVDPFLYSPQNGARVDQANIADTAYYLTNTHTYRAPSAPDARTGIDSKYNIALIFDLPEDYSFGSNPVTTWKAGTYCVACIDVDATRLAFGAYAFRAIAPVGSSSFSNEYILDADKVSGGTVIEDSILEKSPITTQLFMRLGSRQNINNAATQYPDGTYLSVYDIHIKDRLDPDWTLAYQFRSDLDDDSYADYIELQCGTNPTGPSNCNDFDGDTLSNDAEATLGTNQYSVDSDGDAADSPANRNTGNDNLDDDPMKANDQDSDGINNADDNCQSVKNPTQRNFWTTGGSTTSFTPWTSGTPNKPGTPGTFPTAGTLKASQIDAQGDACDDSESTPDGILDAAEDSNSPFGIVDVDATPSAPGGSGAACDDNGDSSPILTDTDGDGLSDFEEVGSDGSRARDTDSLPSPNDCQFIETDPNDADSDGDNIGDNVEKAKTFTWTGLGTIPAINNLRRDSEGDSLDDDVELAGTKNSYCLPVAGMSRKVGSAPDCMAPAATHPLNGDIDGDLISDDREQSKTVASTDTYYGDVYDTDPNNADTDKDGAKDRQEQQPYVTIVNTPVIGGELFTVDDPRVEGPTDPTDAQDKPVSSVPSIPQPDETPDPAALTDPECYVRENGTFTDACYTDQSIFGDLDTRDVHDHDDDGKTNEANNEIDYVEERIFHVDPDEANDPSKTGFDGSSGYTLYVNQPRVGGVPTYSHMLRVGDVSSTDVQELVVFVEYHGGAPRYLSCLYTEGGQLKIVGFNTHTYYNGGDEHRTPSTTDSQPSHLGEERTWMQAADADAPCGDAEGTDGSAVGLVNRALTFWDPMSGLGMYDFEATPTVQFVDANGDHVPESAVLVLPDATTCDDSGFCHAQMDPVVVPLGPGGELPTQDVIDALCAEEGSLIFCPPPAPQLTADAGSDKTGSADQPVSITGSATNAQGTYSCAWSSAPAGAFADANACTTTVTYAANGQYTITLTVTDSASKTATDTASIRIGAAPPAACTPGSSAFPACAGTPCPPGQTPSPAQLCAPSAGPLPNPADIPALVLDVLCNDLDVPSPICVGNPSPVPGDDPVELCSTPSTAPVRICRDPSRDNNLVTGKTNAVTGDDGGLVLEIRGTSSNPTRVHL